MRHRTALLALALLLVPLVGCGDDSSPSAAGDRPTTTTHDSGGTVVLATTTSVPGAATDVGDYEGQRFDFGVITRAESVDGSVWIEFNRQQLYREDGTLMSGTQLTEEPVLYGSTDVPYVDDSPKLRRFVLAPDARVLRIEDPIPCASEPDQPPPVWSTHRPDVLVEGAFRTRAMDSLTFGTDGRITQVRLSSAC
jgi:hypothetical protein